MNILIELFTLQLHQPIYQDKQNQIFNSNKIINSKSKYLELEIKYLV